MPYDDFKEIDNIIEKLNDIRNDKSDYTVDDLISINTEIISIINHQAQALENIIKTNALLLESMKSLLKRIQDLESNATNVLQLPTRGNN